MAYIIPLDQPLSETQAKLIAQIGSMKNLTSLSFLKRFFKKDDSMSLFDYLLKVLRSVGIDPQILLAAFLNELFSTEKLVDLILQAMAQLSTAMKKNIGNATLSFTITSDELTDKQKKELTKANYSYLNSSFIKGPLTTVVDALKTRIIQELMILIFGKPKKPGAAYGPNGLANDENRFNDLLDESVCGGDEIFSVSTPVTNDFGELSYNRLQKLEQVKNGDLTFQITCQGVQISLPDDPTYLFRNVPPGFQSSEPVSPQDAMTNVFKLVENQIQKGTSGVNSQSNALTGAKSFTQKLLETLISSITCLLSPFFVGLVGEIPGEAQGMGEPAYEMLTQGLLNMVFPGSVTTDQNGKRVGEFVPATSCEISKGYNKNNLTLEQKKKVTLMTILCNLILNMAIGFILSYVLEKVKKMIKSFIGKRAQARMNRKITKIKDKQQVTPIGKQQLKIEKSARQVAMMKVLIPVLKPSENVIKTPNINEA